VVNKDIISKKYFTLGNYIIILKLGITLGNIYQVTLFKMFKYR